MKFFEADNAGMEPAAEAENNIRLINASLAILENNKIVDALAKPLPHVDFEDLQRKVDQNFLVDASSITTRMARFFHAISGYKNPSNIFVAGSFQANSIVWLAGGSRLSCRVIGVDPDVEACQVARKNLKAIGFNNVEIFDARAEDLDCAKLDEIQLLLLDADHPTQGKRINIDILEHLKPRLSPEALILAHDACWPSFENDFKEYSQYLRHAFPECCSIKLALDSFGVLVTQAKIAK